MEEECLEACRTGGMGWDSGSHDCFSVFEQKEQVA